jgi:GntR family transcriptional regulator
VKKAYDKLEEEHFIVTVHGKGSFVAATDTGLAAEARRQAAEAKLAEALESVRASGMTREEIYEVIAILLEDMS